MKNYFTRLILVLFVLVIGFVQSYAERVSAEDAALVASNFMNASDSSSQGAKAPARPIQLRRAAVSDDAQYYVYENANGSGWVMVAANDVAHPILAYSETGKFRTDNQPSNVRIWLAGYDKQIKRAEQDGLAAPESIQQEWKALRSGVSAKKATAVVSALVQSGWSQSSPYYKYCPKDAGGTSVTGCVATAMAQVMNYHKWPKQGTGSHSYTWNKCTKFDKDGNCTSNQSTTLTVNFGETTYDWDNILDKYTYLNSNGNEAVISGLTDAQKNAVATLIYHCGVAVDMDYSSAVSGAFTIDYNGYFSGRGTMCAEKALTQYFGYDATTVKGYYRDGDSGTGMKSWSKKDWITMLKVELDAKRPIMYAGVGCDDPNNDDTCYGHSFVCDGYDSDDKFHFNFGWTNWCDGYYDIDALETNDPGTGGGNGSYSLQQDVIVGIQPPITGHIVEVSGTGCAISPEKYNVDNGNSLKVTITPTDATYDFTSVAVKLGSKTLTQNTDYTLSSDKKTLTIKASAITGDSSDKLVITAVWTKNRCNYELIGTDCTTDLSGTLNMNQSLNLTISPNSGYSLSSGDCWAVSMGDDLLEYGSGFTYNATTGAFSISNVTGDVTIIAEAGRQITWRANGSVHATNIAAGDKITLPTDPEDCESGKKFVGWCTNSSYSSASTAPTFAQDGDSYSVSTYYAVYATAIGEGTPTTIVEPMSTSKPYVTLSGWTSDAGGSYTSAGNYGEASPAIKFSASNQYIQSATMSSAITEVSYWYKPQSATGTLSFYVSTNGSTFTELTSEAVSFSESSTAGTKTITLNASSGYKVIKIVYTKETSNVAVDDVTIKYGSASFADYTTACGTPCTNTPTMSFADTTVSKTTADGSFTQAVTISGKGSGQTVAYSSSNEAVATVNASGAVTIKGIGTTTITASVAANGTYCAASASYTLNVSTAPINVTLYYNNTSAMLNNQTNPYTLPTGSPYNAAMCDGDWTFDGWYGSTYDKSSTKPDYITELTATGSAYAVYKTTETTEAAPVRKTAAAQGATLWAEDFGGFSSGDVPSSSKGGSPTVYGGGSVTYSVENGGGTTKVYEESNPGGTSPELLIAKNNGSLKVTGIPSGGATEMSLSFSSNRTTFTVTTTESTKLDISGSSTSWTISVKSGQTTPETFDLTIENTGSSNSRVDDISLTVTTAGSGGGGSTSTTYYATTPECAVACELTGITLNTSSVTTTFVQNGEFNSTGLVVTASYSNCDSKTVTPTSVSTPDMSSAGSKTVTVSYTEGGVTKSATYLITVVAPYVVTYKVCGDVYITQSYAPGAALVLPESPGGFDGLTFAGWTATEHYSGNSAPAYISAGGAVNANVTYYAVFH